MASVKKGIYLHDWEEGFSGLVIFLVVPVMVLLGTIFYFYKFNAATVSQPTQTNPIFVRSKASPWKKYTNKQYGFEITYPAKGVIATSSGRLIGDCGNAIKPDPNDAKRILVDNFYNIKIIPWQKTVIDYIASQGAAKVYDTHPIVDSGADEAIALDNLAKGVEYARGLPPLVYVKSLYKKGNNLYLMQVSQTPDNYGGCVNPATVAPGEYPGIDNLKWDITGSLKFSI